MFYKDSDIEWYINYHASTGRIITVEEAKLMIDFHDEVNRLHDDKDYEDNNDCDYDYDYIDCVDIE
jgi:hypothetical protein